MLRRVLTGPRLDGVKRFLATLLPTAAALALQFVVFAITARGLGVQAFGEYAAILGVAAICVELVGLGGADLLVRAVARAPDRFPLFFGNMLVLIMLTFVPVLLIALWIAKGVMGTSLPAGLAFVALAAEIGSARVSASVELAMVAHGHTFRASCVRMAMAVTRLLAALAYFAVAHRLSGWVWTVLVQSIAFSAGALLAARLSYGRPVVTMQRGELRAGVAFAVNQTARATQGNADRVILAHFTDSAVLGAYAAGSRTLQIGLFPIQVVTRLLYPNFFRHGRDGLAATRRYALKSLPAMLGAGLLACIGVVAVGQVVPAVLGPDFGAARHTAMLLALSLPIIALQYLAADTLTGAGLQHVRALIYGISAIGFGFAMVAGTRLGGVNGLIVAFLAAHTVLMVVLWAIAFSYPEKAWPAPAGA